MRRGRRALLSPTGLAGVALECAWFSAHVASYPFGALRERDPKEVLIQRLDHLPPLVRGLTICDIEAAGTPIVLVHGLVDNRSIFTVLRRALQRRGFGRVVTHSYSVLTSDVESAARRLGQAVERLCEETGYERVHVVGHSLGGLIARWYVQKLGGDTRVHTLITLGSPHAGSRAAILWPTRLGRQLLPGSPVLEELAAPVESCRTRFVAIYSDLDQLVVPQRAARLEHPDLVASNVLVRGVGHLSLPISGRIVREIVMALAHLGSDGSTLQPGVTPIDSSRPEPAARSALTAQRKRKTARG
jgi:pimeloyl-ACP methyl ester carboxylesterase